MKNRFDLVLRLSIALIFGAMLSSARASNASVEPDEIWLQLNPTEQRLEVMLGEHPVVYYKNVAWGSGGIGLKQRQGDEVTPVGSFRVRWINRDSKYRLFFGFDYPNPSYANQGLRSGALTPQQHNKIVRAWEREQIPPQTTAIGGSLGIHGLGRANPEVHAVANWTNGCIALNNTQIEHLAGLISVGTRVVITQ
ncbi:MAG: L,D-transpeptidase family protein [Granulosicoccaceae bacterium]